MVVKLGGDRVLRLLRFFHRSRYAVVEAGDCEHGNEYVWIHGVYLESAHYRLRTIYLMGRWDLVRQRIDRYFRRLAMTRR